MRGRRTPKREWSGGVSLFPVGGSCGGLSWSLESLIIVEEILGEGENLRDGIWFCLWLVFLFIYLFFWVCAMLNMMLHFVHLDGVLFT